MDTIEEIQELQEKQNLQNPIKQTKPTKENKGEWVDDIIFEFENKTILPSSSEAEEMDWLN